MALRIKPPTTANKSAYRILLIGAEVSAEGMLDEIDAAVTFASLTSELSVIASAAFLRAVNSIA